MNKHKHYSLKQFAGSVILILIIIVMGHHAMAQSAAARYEINAKRMDVSPVDKDALPRGREFVRLDSTYYVGWLYQGIYLYERSADKPGFSRALPLLRHSFALLEKEYTGVLQTLYTSPTLYTQNNRVYNDYMLLSKALRDSYEYTDQPDSAMWVLNQMQQKQFKRDFFGVYGTKAWIIHRNRFYTSKEFSFLGNSVAENGTRALNECYKGFDFIARNQYQNNQWFGEYHAEMDRQFIYHYLALIHSYLKNYDSSEYYYNEMANSGTISWNNYGSLKTEIGDFESAVQLYSLDKYRYGGLKSLMEPYYYLPTLSIYAGNTVEAMATAKDAITASQSSPGFGWYNIALARAYLYDGQLDSADITLTKAANFKEVHIGTTLTQPQYDFTIGLLRLIWYEKKIAALSFTNKHWWYQPKALYEMAALRANKYTHEYVLANQLAGNPERDRIIYDLFCGESTVGYDEIWPIMLRYSPAFFIRLMDQYMANDPRLAIRKYFRLFKAILQQEEGKQTLARETLDNLENDPMIDKKHERLFKARVFEQMANVSTGDQQLDYLNKLYEEFPQLIPFSGITPTMGLQINGDEDLVVSEVIKQLKQCKINWTDPTEPDVPVVSLSFKKKGIKYEVTIDARSANNLKMVQGEKFLFQSQKDVGAEIALRSFGKTGAVELESN